ncbi:hypothetical protein JW906_15085, partial [bacterium]|nr:hypothetical protein [bacterium]
MSQHVDNLEFSVDNLRPDKIWKECLKRVEEQVSPQSFRTWFLPLVPLRLEKQNLMIQVPNRFFYEWIEEHYPLVIRKALSQV